MEVAKTNNIPIIITSDHGNIEDVAHLIVLMKFTTIILNKKTKLSHFPARLYDIGPTIRDLWDKKPYKK